MNEEQREKRSVAIPETIAPIVVRGMSDGEDSPLEWGVSLSGPNPEPQHYIACADRDDAYKLKDLLAAEPALAKPQVDAMLRAALPYLRPKTTPAPDALDLCVCEEKFWDDHGEYFDDIRRVRGLNETGDGGWAVEDPECPYNNPDDMEYLFLLPGDECLRCHKSLPPKPEPPDEDADEAAPAPLMVSPRDQTLCELYTEERKLHDTAVETWGVLCGKIIAWYELELAAVEVTPDERTPLPPELLARLEETVKPGYESAYERGNAIRGNAIRAALPHLRAADSVPEHCICPEWTWNTAKQRWEWHDDGDIHWAWPGVICSVCEKRLPQVATAPAPEDPTPMPEVLEDAAYWEMTLREWLADDEEVLSIERRALQRLRIYLSNDLLPYLSNAKAAPDKSERLAGEDIRQALRVAEDCLLLVCDSVVDGAASKALGFVREALSKLPCGSPAPAPTPDFAAMTPDELRAWLDKRGRLVVSPLAAQPGVLAVLFVRDTFEVIASAREDHEAHALLALCREVYKLASAP